MIGVGPAQSSLIEGDEVESVNGSRDLGTDRISEETMEGELIYRITLARLPSTHSTGT